MLDQLLPIVAALDPWVILGVIVACFAAAAVSGMSGFGAGLIMTLFITPIIGAKAVIPVLSVVMAITNLSRVWFFRAGLDWRVMLLIGVPAAATSALGAMVYVRLDSDAVQALLGIVLMLSIPLRRWLSGRKVVPGTATLAGFGGVFGFLSSIMVGAGILVIPILLGAGLAGPALLATDAAIAVLVNIVKMAMFGSLDALTLELTVIALVMGLCTVPGTWVAAWIVRHTSLRIHTLAIEGLIVAGGAVMVATSLFG